MMASAIHAVVKNEQDVEHHERLIKALGMLTKVQRNTIRLKRNPKNETAQREVKRLEKYIRSPDFEDLTDLNPDYLIRKMRQLVDEEY